MFLSEGVELCAGLSAARLVRDLQGPAGGSQSGGRRRLGELGAEGVVEEGLDDEGIPFFIIVIAEAGFQEASCEAGGLCGCPGVVVVGVWDEMDERCVVEGEGD